MKNIENIYCFGTSFSAGGGFEFDSPQKEVGILRNFYKELEPEINQFNFSWPGQLQKLLNNIKVINNSKSGFGNDRIYRMTDEIIESESFDKDKSLFIFELSYIGRKEYFLNTLNDYVVYNYNLEKKEDDLPGVGYEYFYDDYETMKKLNHLKKHLIPISELTFNRNEIEKELFRNIRFFISHLNQNNIKYLIIDSPIFGENIQFELEGEKFDGLSNLVFSEKYSIKKETNEKVNDLHLGYFGNKLVAFNIYNTLIDRNYFEGSKINFNKNKFVKLKENLM